MYAYSKVSMVSANVPRMRLCSSLLSYQIQVNIEN